MRLNVWSLELVMHAHLKQLVAFEPSTYLVALTAPVNCQQHLSTALIWILRTYASMT